MLALARHRELSCPSCSGWLPDTTEAEAEGKYSFQPVRCHRCAAQSIAADRSREMYRPDSLLLQDVSKPRR